MSLIRRLLGLGSPSASDPAPPAEAGRVRRVLRTDSGLFAVWDPAAWAHVVDYDTWEPELLDEADLARQVERGALVPVGVGADGAFEFEARVGGPGRAAEPSERERRYLTVSSEPYLLVSEGELVLSGLERVGASPGDAVARLRVPPGRYAVTAHLLAWDREPGATGPDGKPLPTALPDFLVLVNPAEEGGAYRTSTVTFPRPPADG